MPSYILTYRDIKRIVCAVAIQAAQDALRGDSTAYAWFASTGLVWLDLIDVDFNPEWLPRIKPHRF